MAHSRRQVPQTSRAPSGELQHFPNFCFNFSFKMELRTVKHFIDVKAVSPQPEQQVGDKSRRHFRSLGYGHPFMA